MNRLTYEEAIENIAFTLKLAARGTPFVIECPEGNVIISPVANSTEQLTEETSTPNIPMIANYDRSEYDLNELTLAPYEAFVVKVESNE